MSDDKPAPILPRAALERVLLRAAELHAAGTDVPETMSEADLLSLANEVGISPTAVKQALAEERMRVTLPEERGLAAWLAGPAAFAASRVVPGTSKDVLERIDKAFQREENLAERRRFPDRIVWGPRSGFAAGMKALMGGLDGRGFPLSRADEVNATVIQVEPGRVHVRVEATTEARRTSALRSGVVGLAVGGVLTTILVALNVFAPLALAAGALIAGTTPVVARRNYRRDAGHTQLAIEQSLDRLEFGESRKRGLIDQLLIP